MFPQQPASMMAQLFSQWHCPAKETIRLNLSGVTTSDIRIQLMDATGRVLQTQENLNGGMNYDFDIKNLAAGSYVMMMVSGGDVKALRFTKQ